MSDPASPGQTRDALLTFLLDRVSRINFFQFCRLLEERAPDRPGLGTKDGFAEPIRFRSYPRMGFPASEVQPNVANRELDDLEAGLPPSVRTRFLGLYGVDAMIPSHFIDDVTLRVEGYEAVIAFLDQFHHRFTTHFYRAWKKYRYPIGFRPGGADERSRDLLALAGFGIGDKPGQAGLPASRALSLLGLLNQRTRTAEGLAGAIALTVPGAQVEVGEFEPVWTKVSDPARLSSREDWRTPSAGKGLGKSTVLGKRIPYRSKAVKLTLSPANEAQTYALLPGGILHGDVMGIIRLYLGAKADVILRMKLNTAVMPKLRLNHIARNTAIVPEDDGETREPPLPRLSWTALLKPDGDRDIIIALGRYIALESAASAPRPSRSRTPE